VEHPDRFFAGLGRFLADHADGIVRAADDSRGGVDRQREAYVASGGHTFRRNQIEADQ
jgi:hypothetical protein